MPGGAERFSDDVLRLPSHRPRPVAPLLQARPLVPLPVPLPVVDHGPRHDRRRPVELGAHGHQDDRRNPDPVARHRRRPPADVDDPALPLLLPLPQPLHLGLEARPRHRLHEPRREGQSHRHRRTRIPPRQLRVLLLGPRHHLRRHLYHGLAGHAPRPERPRRLRRRTPRRLRRLTQRERQRWQERGREDDRVLGPRRQQRGSSSREQGRLILLFADVPSSSASPRSPRSPRTGPRRLGRRRGSPSHGHGGGLDDDDDELLE
mmetsp:Transcript_9407/g.30688  ORF Transcript_9407/g.30688 Transcript_9407/m.30688 type:complete len:262 (+) Transcript_9407:3955-4740(+)